MGAQNNTNEENSKPIYPIIPPPLPLGLKIIHIIVLAIGWLLYVYFVLRGIMQAKAFEIKLISFFMTICLCLIPIMTYSWIIHNVNIFKKKGPRKGSISYPEKYDNDFFNTPVIADWETLKQSKKIHIKVTPESKQFVANNMPSH